MKSLVILCVLALVGLSIAGTNPYPRGCIYVLGHCVRGCEEGTHGYSTGCGVLTPEPTCENPEPKADPNGGHICDYSACYCDAPTVRDTVKNKCVPLEECPKSKEEDPKSNEEDSKSNVEDPKNKEEDPKIKEEDPKSKEEDQKNEEEDPKSKEEECSKEE